jgi:pyridoxine kinase
MKRVITIQDVSCFGKCSLTVALPLISAMGVECAIIPTAVLSTHTGGFTGFTFTDLTEDIPKISKHWQSCDLKFDTIYTGYLGSTKQIDYVIDFIKTFKSDETLVCIDPAMADKGKLYTGFDDEFPSHMARLCAVADVVVPNITEACLMTKTEYKESYDEAYVKELLLKLCDLGAKKAVLTGIKLENATQGAVLYDSNTKEFYSYYGEQMPMDFHGTGDTFASVFAGALTRGMDIKDALALAVDFTVECIRTTIPFADQHRYGTMFESCIPYLVDRLK